MKRKPELLMKSFSGLVSMAMVASSILTVPVMAEEGLEETWTTEMVSEAAEDVQAVFVISDFEDFHKTEAGEFEDTEMQEKYGDFKAVPGTSMEQLDLPDKLTVVGYWQADGAAETLVLEDLEWKLKSDMDETYSEASPEGNYTFVPDLDAYLETEEGIDAFAMADESVKLPEISLTVAAQEETETQETSENAEDVLPEGDGEESLAEADPDIAQPVDGQTEAAPAEEGVVAVPEETEAAPAEEGVVAVPEETEAAPAEEGIVAVPEETEAAPAEENTGDTSGENIFDGLDDSVLDGGDGEIEVYDTPETTDNTTAETEEPTAAESETQPASESEDGTVVIAEEAEPIVTQDTVPESEAAETQTPAVEEPAAAATAEISITITDVKGNVLYSYTDANNNNVLVLTADEEGVDHTVTVPAISGVSCAADLSTLILNVSGAGNSADKTYALAEIANGTETGSNTWNFAGGVEKTFHLTEYNEGVETGNKYTVKFAGITQNSHTPGNNATCKSDATCTVCGVSIPGTMTSHQFTPATCTEPETCVVCGETGAAAKGHTWNAATCTAPQTCSVCGATQGEALGHDWSAATCTEPKTCKRCGATEGKALGHDMNNDWETTASSTGTTHGTQIRYCSRDCGYYEERALNIIGNPDHNTIVDLTEGGQYNLNTRITFTASGAAMGNTDPISGDVRYVPLSWSIQGTPGTFMDGFTGAFSISKAGSYTVTVVFQKQIYEEGSWKATDVTDSKSVTFTVGNLVQGELVGTSDGIRINPQTGDSTPIVPLVIALVAAVAVILGVLVIRKKKK